MKEKKHRLVVDGNAFYEVDLECERKKKEENEKRKKLKSKQNVGIEESGRCRNIQKK